MATLTSANARAARGGFTRWPEISLSVTSTQPSTGPAPLGFASAALGTASRHSTANTAIRRVDAMRYPTMNRRGLAPSGVAFSRDAYREVSARFGRACARALHARSSGAEHDRPADDLRLRRRQPARPDLRRAAPLLRRRGPARGGGRRRAMLQGARRGRGPATPAERLDRQLPPALRLPGRGRGVARARGVRRLDAACACAPAVLGGLPPTGIAHHPDHRGDGAPGP